MEGRQLGVWSQYTPALPCRSLGSQIGPQRGSGRGPHGPSGPRREAIGALAPPLVGAAGDGGADGLEGGAEVNTKLCTQLDEEIDVGWKRRWAGVYSGPLKQFRQPFRAMTWMESDRSI